MPKPKAQPKQTTTKRREAPAADPTPAPLEPLESTPPTSRSQLLSAELGTLTGDEELDEFLVAECAKPAYGEPLPESSEPTSSPLSTSTLWVLACERPATPATPRACWYWTADGWADESDRHLAIPFRDEARAQRALETQGDELRMFEGWLGAVAAPLQRFSPRAGT